MYSINPITLILMVLYTLITISYGETTAIPTDIPYTECCDCTEVSPDPGCPIDPNCEDTICALPNEQVCCDFAWDEECTRRARTQCRINTPTVRPGRICCACVFTPAPSSPGCPADPICEDILCNADPYCCRSAWDTECVDSANAICEETTPFPTASPITRAPTRPGDESNAKAYNGVKISNVVEVSAIATLDSKAGMNGAITVVGNGDISMILDVSQIKYNNPSCTVLEYGIYQNVPSANECTFDTVGSMYNPFGVSRCSEHTENGDTYFKCAIGDLSGRFGDISIDNKISDSIIIEGNISEDRNNKEGGFCGSRLTPQHLYGKSIVFRCNDEKTIFCANFQIKKHIV